MKESIKVAIVASLVMIGLKLGVIFAPHGQATAMLQYGVFIVFLAGVYVAIRRTRDKECGGNIEFRRGLGAGVLYGTVAAILISIYQFVEWTHGDIREMIWEMSNAGVSHSDIQKALGNYTRQNLFSGAITLATTNIIIAFLTSLAATLLLRRKQMFS